MHIPFLQQRESRKPLGAAPTTSSMLGYNFPVTTSNNEVINITGTGNTGIVYSPASGNSTNYLLPGVYIISTYNYSFFYNTTSASINLSLGIATNATTTPTGSTPVGQVIANSVNVTNPGNFHSYVNYPTFIINVTTPGYYYGYTQITSITSYIGTGYGGYGGRIIGITRIA